ncbi:MAG: chorismate synthase [Clostridia bacterium]|nr:chorismate synthase [Clostridia bacterium]
MSNVEIKIYGGSHEEVIGVSIIGIPKGAKIDDDAIKEMLRRRGASSSPWSTPRKEKDEVIFRSGVQDGIATGEPIVAEIINENVRPSDYAEVLNVPRPSHADYVSYYKYGKIFTGGGKFSGRLTAPLCIAGAIIKSLLKDEGITLGAYVSSIGKINGKSYKDEVISLEEIEIAHKEPLPTLTNAQAMVDEVLESKRNLDSVGGTVECIVYGLPIGLGDNLTSGMESSIAYEVYGVPGVKGVEFGDGFNLASSYGSLANDAYVVEDDKITLASNKSGGINGGITNGMPLTLKVALRPTPSIAKEQDSVNLITKEPTKISVKGRHDSCIVPRAVAAIESAVAIAIYKKLIEQGK